LIVTPVLANFSRATRGPDTIVGLICLRRAPEGFDKGLICS
jgi:hypothetical protein